jgi:phosphate transport system protein
LSGPINYSDADGGDPVPVHYAAHLPSWVLHVAKTARRRHPTHAIPDDVSDYFAEMGRIAVNIGHDAKDVVLSGDPDKAAKLADEDDAMDELHRHLFTVVMDHPWPHPVATAVDVTLLSRYYERFADHAVEIGRRVIFQATGAPIM